MDINSFQDGLSALQSDMGNYGTLEDLKQRKKEFAESLDTNVIVPLVLHGVQKTGLLQAGAKALVTKVAGEEAGQKASALVDKVLSSDDPVATVKTSVQGLKTAAVAKAQEFVGDLESTAGQVQSRATAAVTGAINQATTAANNAVESTTSVLNQVATAAGDVSNNVVSQASSAAGNVQAAGSRALGAALEDTSSSASSRVLAGLQDPATAMWGSDSTLARLAPNIRARIGQGEQIAQELFANLDKPPVPAAATQVVPGAPPTELSQSAQPSSTAYEIPEDGYVPKAAPGTSTELTDLSNVGTDLGEAAGKSLISEAIDGVSAFFDAVPGLDVLGLIGGGIASLVEGLDPHHTAMPDFTHPMFQAGV